MKPQDLFKSEWQESVQEYSDSILDALLTAENAQEIITSNEHGAVFRELLCEMVTVTSEETGEFELTQENLNELLKTATIYVSLLNLQQHGIIEFTKDENGEEAFTVTPQGMELQ